MKRTFLIGVAAGALLAGVNIASAQGMNERQQQPNASGKIEQKGGGLETKGSASGGAELKANEPGAKARAQAPDTKAMENKAQEQRGDQKGQRAQDLKAQDKDQMKSTTGQAQEQKGQRAQERDQMKGTTGSQDLQKQEGTKGQAAQGDMKASGSASAGGKVNLSAEQKTKIRETVIRSSNAPRVTNVNFSVSVGTVIPRTVHLAPLPPVLVELYPAWRSYEYIIVGEQIIIIEPSSYKIVAVLDV